MAYYCISNDSITSVIPLPEENMSVWKDEATYFKDSLLTYSFFQNRPERDAKPLHPTQICPTPEVGVHQAR